MSVVIPVFNRPFAVRRAIESALKQTFQDFEIVVVDDGSTDDTVEAVTSIGDPRIRLIQHERSRGGSAARNTGIRESAAEYIAFLDSDDEWLPRKLECQLDVFERSSGTLGLVYTGEEAVASNGHATRFIPAYRRDLVKTLLIENVIGGCSLGMVPRHVLDAVGGFDESLTSRQDVDMWLRIAEKFEVDFVPEVLVVRADGDDRSRISTSVSGTMNGWELFLRKYREKLVDSGVLHLYLLETGRMYHRRAKDPIAARRFYKTAIAAKPAALVGYPLFVATFLPTSWLARLVRLVDIGIFSPLGIRGVSDGESPRDLSH